MLDAILILQHFKVYILVRLSLNVYSRHSIGVTRNRNHEYVFVKCCQPHLTSSTSLVSQFMVFYFFMTILPFLLCIHGSCYWLIHSHHLITIYYLHSSLNLITLFWGEKFNFSGSVFVSFSLSISLYLSISLSLFLFLSH